MKYDFETILDRSSHQFIAVDYLPAFSEQAFPKTEKIPMWVADMSFPTAPCVIDEIKKRLEMPNLGYFHLSDEYYEKILTWHMKRKPLNGLSKELIRYENGVLGGVSSAIQAFTSPGDKVFLHAPVYCGFLHVLESIGRIPCTSSLYMDENNVWRINYDDMEDKLKSENIHIAVFCSPHNPCGRVWEKEEIEKCMDLFAKYNCVVISDEIWSDIIMPGFRHVPTQSINEWTKMNTIAFYSPSKTFSLAGLVGSYSVTFNTYLRDRLEKKGAMSHYNSCNTLSTAALYGAYSNEGNEWCDEMILTIKKNMDYALSFINSNLPVVRAMEAQGTYMLFMDCAEYLRNKGEDFEEFFQRGIENGVIWQSGREFSWENSIRLNLALPHSLCMEAFRRMKEYIFI